ncbi:MAG: M50 family metallopeptidase [Elusimicrobia bacterium]|nr:M50 family metallopeptidase [Candidatus Liberimonas magnetica]
MFHIAGLNVTIFQIVATIFGIGILVFVHELGHFIMAKKFKLKVEKFTFGFGPEIFGYTYGETRYAVCAIPLGGMVKMPGEDIESATGSPGEFYSQPWYKRLIIAFAGPFMNYVFAVIIFAIVIFVWGLAKPSDLPKIGEVIEGYPAQTAGIQAGDTVLKINGVAVTNWADMAGYIHSHSNEELKLLISRSNENITFKIIPKKDDVSGFGVIGISPQFETEYVTLPASAWLGTKMVIFQSLFTLEYLGQKLIKFEKPDVAGPIGVIQYLAKAAKTGWRTLLHFLAVISTALGLFNLLPIPILDGGHIFIALIEGIIRRPVNKKTIITANMVGLSIIVLIFILATYNDITRIMQ